MRAVRAAASATRWSSPHGPGRGLVGRLGDQRGQRRPGDGGGDCCQTGGLGGLRAEQSGDEHPVEGVDGGQRLVEPVDGVGEQVRTHQAAVLVGGNHCISGSGAVVGSSSR